MPQRDEKSRTKDISKLLQKIKKTFDTKLKKIFIYLHVPKQKNTD